MCKRKVPFRCCIGVMLFLSAASNYMLRANIPVSVVEMSKPLISNQTATCGIQADPSKDLNHGEWSWNQHEQGQIVAAYFYGTMVTFLPGGTLAEWLGGDNVIFYTSLGTAVLTAVTPIATYGGGFWALWSLRFFIGVLGGPVYPAINVLVAHWAPMEERGKFLTSLEGNTVGSMVAWLTVGATTHEWGWEAGFYSMAVLMTVFCVVFFSITTQSPGTNRWVSQEEKEYIYSHQGGTVSQELRKIVPPYRKIMSCKRFWAIIVCQFGNLWGLNLMMLFTTKYFKETLGFNLMHGVGYAVMPYIGRFITSQMFGILGDWMVKKQVWSVANIRRFFVIISHILPAILFYFMYLCGCEWIAALCVLILTQLMTGAVVAGHVVNIQDLSPNFAGTLYGIMNWIAGTSGFLVPWVNAAVLHKFEKDAILGAAVVYMVGGGVMILCAIFFIIFVSGDIQPWNHLHESEEQGEGARKT